MLRCFKSWAKQRGVYEVVCEFMITSNVLLHNILQLHDFLGGVHFAVLAAYVCQRHSASSLNYLIVIFFLPNFCILALA